MVRRRRRIAGEPEPLGLIEDEHYHCTRRCVLILLPDRYVAAHRRSVFALLVDELQLQLRFAGAHRTKGVREAIPWSHRCRPAGLPGVRRRHEGTTDANADDPVGSGWCTERELVTTRPVDANARRPVDAVDHGTARIRVIGATLEDTERFPFTGIRSYRCYRHGGFRGAGDGGPEGEDECCRPHGNLILVRRTLLSHEDTADLQHALRLVTRAEKLAVLDSSAEGLAAITAVAEPHSNTASRGRRLSVARG